MGTIRVARIITRLNVGGPAYQAALLNHMLPRCGYQCLLIHGSVAPGETSFDELLEKYPGEVRQISSLSRSISPLADLAALRQLVRILREYKPHIVHTHTAKAGFLGRLAAGITGAKTIVHTYHGHVLEGYFRGPMRWSIIATEQLLARRTDRLVTVSPRLTAELSERFHIAPPQKFATIELGLPLDRFAKLPSRGQWRGRLGIPEQAIVLGSLGRLAPIKNHRRMLEVFSQLMKLPGVNPHLMIGGTGLLESDLRQAARELGIASHVHFLGRVEDLPAFYADIDIAILTSDNEGTPVTLLETQAAGKYCVAPDVGGIADVLDPEAGVLVSPNSVEAYVAALRPILENWPRAGNAPESVRSRVIERFSPDRLVQYIDTLYKDFLHKAESQ